MSKFKDINLEKTFNLAIKNHLERKIDIAQDLYNQVLKINPNYADAHNNLGAIFNSLGEVKKAKECYEKAIEINPNYADAYNNLGAIFKELEENTKAKNCFEKAIESNPNHTFALNNLGVIYKELAENQKAIECYEKAIEVDPNYANSYSNLGNAYTVLRENQKAKKYLEKAIEINPNHTTAYNNLGTVFSNLGEAQKAKNCYEKAIEINPNYADAHNNLGVMFANLGKLQKAKNCHETAIKINPSYAHAYKNLGSIFNSLGEVKKAKEYYEKAIEINPNYVEVYWNLHSTTSNIDGALSILKKLYKIDNRHIKAKIMISALEGYRGNFNKFNKILKSSNSNHPFTRSINWVFSLPKLPEIFFNKFEFFDGVIKLADNSRPFYEFGVWNGSSFQYLINAFKVGFGFDTFSGIPEDWHEQPKGTYSSFGVIPKIEGGKFIVGKFEDTLPEFFSKERPMASLINFDADLYSSTLCALYNSNKVIDEKTILVFDELLMNRKWEEDEFKALNEFCNNFKISYEVIAISFVTKQVAVRLKKN